MNLQNLCCFRISNRGRLGARREELRSLRDAPHRPQLGDATRQNQLSDQKSHSVAPRQLQLADGDPDSEEPPVEEDHRDVDFRTPALKAGTVTQTVRNLLSKKTPETSTLGLLL